MNTRSSFPVFIRPWVPPSAQKVTSPAFTATFFVFVRVFPFPFQQVIGFVVPQMLVDGNGTARMQGNPGEQVVGPLEQGRIHQDFLFDGPGSRIGDYLFCFFRKYCHKNLLLHVSCLYYKPGGRIPQRPDRRLSRTIFLLVLYTLARPDTSRIPMAMAVASRAADTKVCIPRLYALSMV